MKDKDYQLPKQKQNPKKNLKPGLSTDVPSFDYKGAFFIVLELFVILNVIPMICVALHIPPGWPTTILGGIISGFTVAYNQKKVERFSRTFWWITAFVSLVIGAIIYLLFFRGVML